MGLFTKFHHDAHLLKGDGETGAWVGNKITSTDFSSYSVALPYFFLDSVCLPIRITITSMKRFSLLVALALVGTSSATLRADDPKTYSHGFLYKISTKQLSDVVYNYSETYLSGISSNWVIGNAGQDWSNPLSTNTGFLTNIATHESRVINVPGSIGGSVLTAICGNIVTGYYYYGGTNVVRNFLYRISDGFYRTNITFTNSYPWATNATFQYTSETYAVADNWYESNSYTTNFNNNTYTTNTNNSQSDIIVYKISNASNTLVKYPTNPVYTYAYCYPTGISSNIVLGHFWGWKNSANYVDYSTNGSFYYNADTGVYSQLPPINGNTPYGLVISGDVILGSWYESVKVSSNSWTNKYYLFKYSTQSNSYIQTNIASLIDDIAAFEGNLAVGNMGTNYLVRRAYLYDMLPTINNTNNPIVIGPPSSYATGISGDYVIGGYYSTDPIIAPPPAPAPIVSSGGGGGSSSKKTSASKSSAKKPATKKKSSKKRK